MSSVEDMNEEQGSVPQETSADGVQVVEQEEQKCSGEMPPGEEPAADLSSQVEMEQSSPLDDVTESEMDKGQNEKDNQLEPAQSNQSQLESQAVTCEEETKAEPTPESNPEPTTESVRRQTEPEDEQGEPIAASDVEPSQDVNIVEDSQTSNAIEVDVEPQVESEEQPDMETAAVTDATGATSQEETNQVVTVQIAMENESEGAVETAAVNDDIEIKGDSQQASTEAENNRESAEADKAADQGLPLSETQPEPEPEQAEAEAEAEAEVTTMPEPKLEAESVEITCAEPCTIPTVQVEVTAAEEDEEEAFVDASAASPVASPEPVKEITAAEQPNEEKMATKREQVAADAEDKAEIDRCETKTEKEAMPEEKSSIQKVDQVEEEQGKEEEKVENGNKANAPMQSEQSVTQVQQVEEEVCFHLYFKHHTSLLQGFIFLPSFLPSFHLSLSLARFPLSYGHVYLTRKDTSSAW